MEKIESLVPIKDVPGILPVTLATVRAWVFQERLPLSVPACTAVGILSFAENFNQYLWPLLMSSSETVKTLPVGIAQFAPSSSQGSTEITDYYGMGAAAATLLAIPSLVIFLILQWFFISIGLTQEPC
jgi:ABC-type glycerol-3-phosphate transport system permease component